MVSCWRITTFFIAVATVSTVAWGQNEFEYCDTDYAVLEKALLNTDNNLYKLTTTFFPPHVDNPLYITVTYNFTATNVKYIWSSASLYLTIHPRIMRYLSLFFCYVEDSRIKELVLQLPGDCTNLTKNSQSDTSNFLFVLTQKLQLYAYHSGRGHILLQDGFDSRVVAAVRHEIEYAQSDSKGVKLFFSLPLIFPIMTLFLCWLCTKGARAYIRNYISKSEPHNNNYPTIAAVYWIGQSFALFVIVADVFALLSKRDTNHTNCNSICSTYVYNDSAVINSTYDSNGSYAGLFGTYNGSQDLEEYQFIIIATLCAFEFLLLLSFLVFVLIVGFRSCSSDKCVLCCFKYLCYWNLKVEPKKARLWLILGGFIPPIVSLSSHIGFIIGGWISYEDRSIAIVLLYLFIFVFLFFPLQYSYTFLDRIIKRCVKRQTNSSIEEGNFPPHLRHQVKGIVCEKNRKESGFQTIALLLMLVIVVIFNCITAYLVFGILLLPLLESVDDVLTHIYALGEYAFFFAVFLLTYNSFSVNKREDNTSGLVSKRTLRYWRYLYRGSLYTYELRQKAVVSLINAASHIKYAEKCFSQLEKFALGSQTTTSFTEAKNSFESAIGHLQFSTSAKDYVQTALNYLGVVIDPQQNRNNVLQGLKIAERLLKSAAASLGRESVAPQQEAVGFLEQAENHLQNGVKVLRETMEDIPCVRGMKDQADALTAALLFRKMSESPIKENSHYSLLLSSIEEEID